MRKINLKYSIYNLTIVYKVLINLMTGSYYISYKSLIRVIKKILKNIKKYFSKILHNLLMSYLSKDFEQFKNVIEKES